MAKVSRERPKGDKGRCTKSKRRYSKKRKWHGKIKSKQSVETTTGRHAESQNQSSVNENPTDIIPLNTEEPQEPLPLDSSIAKIVDIEVDVATAEQTSTTSAVEKIEEELSGYCFIDLSVLNTAFNFTACPSCLSTGSLKLSDNVNFKKGLSRMLQLSCGSCPYQSKFQTSKEIDRVVKGDGDKNKSGNKYMEVNARAVYGTRAIGAGHKHLEKFCSYMNMPEPMNIRAFDNMSSLLRDAVRSVAENSMESVANELHKDADDVAVSIDGTWQRRGFTSTLGVVTAISVDKGKVLDCSIKSKSCKGCTRMEKIRKTNTTLMIQ